MLLKVEQLKTYFGTAGNPVRAVDDVSFELDRGETLCLVGESGSGKSVTALSILQLVAQPAGFHPGGKILYEYMGSGRPRTIDLMALSEAAKRKVRGQHISMIFQEPMTSLNPVFTVGFQIAEPLRRHLGLSRAQADRKAIEALDQVAIPDPSRRFGEYPHQLSGGMRQRVMIAMAMACQPDLLIADEPTTALDVTIQAQILDLMRQLQKDRGTAILFITHDFGVVRQMADSVAVMQSGKIVEVGETEGVLFSPEDAYTRQLIAALPGNLPKPRIILPEETEAPAQTDAPSPLIKIEGLKVHFPINEGFLRRTTDYVRAVDGVDLEIGLGKIMALVGESGCGKTTLGKAIIRLIEPTAGTVHYKGQNLLELDASAMRQHRSEVQIIFQDPFSSLNPRMMIGDTISEGLAAQGWGKSHNDRLDMSRRALARAQMDPDVVHRYPHEFSGGQRQRIGIARCLAVQPNFIVCDEITSALDVSVQASILQLLLELRQTLGLTLLFVTHNMEVVEYLADEVAVMYQGKIIEQGPTDAVCGQPTHAYTQQLLAAVPRLVGSA